MIKTDFLRDIVIILQKGMNSVDTFEAVFTLLEKSINFDSATLFLYNQKDDRLEVIHQKGDETVDLAKEIPFDRGSGISSYISKQKKPIILQSLSKARPGKEQRFNSFVSLPLWVGEKLIGVLNIGHSEPNFYKQANAKDFEIIAFQISIIMEKMVLRKKIEEQNLQLQKALKELEGTQEQLIEKERLAAIGEVIVTVNHEINNPLTAIIGIAEILEIAFETGRKEKIKEGLKGILQAAKRIKKVTHKLSKISSTTSKEYIGSLSMLKLD